MEDDTTPTYPQLAFWTVPGTIWTVIGFFGTGPGNGVVFAAAGIACLLGVVFYALRRRRRGQRGKKSD
ncbi:LPXTG cell wall anchor domain-containing protein [Amycolatopsis sp. QT-25]|uniref:LPXTG cell wall anchor domain-containing protein n=1 Tax=Amycolatopsis sp. QT-25 TaxID=3034022 RepID=UPI0023EB0587|nr:LPXTG cell wall anchor domain-containing protein [Amycolatopsis sp. QT-25]WET82423.1 LPXTG cell wall anchor domain-containing protein [Amycolatopsis sp. QT-25]